jgi:hypothetical protein
MPITCLGSSGTLCTWPPCGRALGVSADDRTLPLREHPLAPFRDKRSGRLAREAL